ncbi:hypothetical protein EEB13_30740 [Rhodococcus sp. WS3]|uniref:hypothetical protein n=1 Tax=unclassified Rhodococcus (in: high G+C Gram-positive bacteria) TaxID=192944 RepID=UPI0005D37FD1|nr:MULTISPECIES: hypothetical protein [unclassified Rhodococcus (in: high G+C Gram-positive bacteria)]KJF19203.1 hypothetical protein SZ00_06130 [Rhodococcus sp. AD45]ROZ42814.1 hypothetical protein EEB13_30740 [Rhodococcus sp. WS3]RZL20882.1 MAG: hypothetical protein EOP31_30575 [Rhodococcus sp. (in: high G+C Gram-positive bacteria)]
MALHLPKPRSKKPVQQAVGLDGLKVSVANAATSGVEKSKTVKTGGLAGLTSKVSVRQIRTQIGNDGLRQAAIDAGRTPPSDRTLRRWAQQGRIPHSDVAERAQRRAAIERLGGIGAVAKKIGRSPSAVSRYRSGATNELRADAKKKLKKVKADDIMTRAGVLRPDGTPKKATIRVKGGVSVRNGSEEGYDYRVRTLDFANSDVPFTAEESRELASALANDDNARVVALLERHATLDYPENKGFDRYSNDFGFHFDSIESVHIDWK